MGEIEVKGILKQVTGKQYKIIIKRVEGNRDSDKKLPSAWLEKWTSCKCLDGSYRLTADVTRPSTEPEYIKGCFPI